MWNRMRRWIRTGCVRYTTNYQMTKVNIQLFNHSEIARFKNTAEPKVFTVAVAPADRPYLHIKGFHFANGIAHMPQIHWHIGTKVSHQLFLNVNTCLSCFWHCAHFRIPDGHICYSLFSRPPVGVIGWKAGVILLAAIGWIDPLWERKSVTKFSWHSVDGFSMRSLGVSCGIIGSESKKLTKSSKGQLLSVLDELKPFTWVGQGICLLSRR